VPPFKVCSNDVLVRYAQAAEDGCDERAILAAHHLGRRHDRLIASLASAVRAGLEKDPHTLPRRRGRDPNHVPLTPEEMALQDKLKAGRDRVAAKLAIEPTLIANRSQLAQIARDPDKIATVLLPWQTALMSSA
jgi:ribonuclease D